MRSIRSQIGASTTVILIACFVVILIGLAGAMTLMRNTNTGKDDAYRNVNINNFDDCVEAGNKIQEKYPEVCETSDGRSFTKPNGGSIKQF